MKVFSTATIIGQAFKNAGRVTEILRVFGKHGFNDLVHRMKLSRFQNQEFAADSAKAKLPPQVRLRMSFEELGPTFVKLGQLLATRPDFIPEAYIEEFEKLQDNVSSVPFKDIRNTIENELKNKIEDVFASFEETPMAAASIAQVHGGVLKTGEKVAIKIQRPGIEPLITNDVSILRGLAILLERYIPETRVANPTGMVEEFFRTILFELDFRVEANNMRRIKKNLDSLERISVPQVHMQLSTNRVLVLERFEGVRFSDREAILSRGIDPVEIVNNGVEAFFHMVMRDGLFHGDLHAGNMFVLENGKIGLIDFGIVGRLSMRVRDSIIVMFTAILDEDFDTLASEYMGLCHPVGQTDFNRLQKDLMDSISPYIGMALGEVNIGQVLLRSTAIATRHSLVVPRELLLLFRAILTIEALGKKLDPTFDLLPVGIKLARQTMSYRYGKDRVMHDLVRVGRDMQGFVETLPRLMKRFVRRWEANQFAVEVRNKDVERLSHSVRILSFCLLLATFSIGWFGLGTALLISHEGLEIRGVPVLALGALAMGVLPSAYALWRLRRHFK